MFNILLKSYDKNRYCSRVAGLTWSHTHAHRQPPSKGKMVPVSSLQNLLGRIMKIQEGDKDLTALEK